MNVWLIVALAIVVVLVSILVFRLHAFLALLAAGLLVAALTPGSALVGYAQIEVDRGNMSLPEAQSLVKTNAPSRLATSFGEMTAKIGILIALASIIGQCLLESGAASAIVQRMLAVTGPKRAPEALAAGSFVLAIPVFFDTVFYLMLPLARSLRARVGGHYVLFILAILAGGSLAHSLVPPTPGPLLVAELVKVDIGTMMVAGLVIGGCGSIVSLAAARLLDRWVDVPLRLEEDLAAEEAAEDPSDQPQPSIALALAPIVVPILLIAAGSVANYLSKQAKAEAEARENAAAVAVEVTAIPEKDDVLVEPPPIDGYGVVKLLGNKNIALGFGALLAMALVKYCPKEKRRSLVSRALASGGTIILITAAGGAFGAMLRQAGIEEGVKDIAQGVPGLMILPVAFLITASVRTVQGSATVAMVTSAGILQGFAGEGLPFHPVYLAMAIGAGSKPISWMNDSAFWVITRMTGMTESEGLRTISPLSTIMGLTALFFTMLFAWIYPAV